MGCKVGSGVSLDSTISIDGIVRLGRGYAGGLVMADDRDKTAVVIPGSSTPDRAQERRATGMPWAVPFREKIPTILEPNGTTMFVAEPNMTDTAKAEANLLNLLIVDDERAIRDGCREVAQAIGFSTYIADNADHAYRVIETTGVDVALVDLRLPGTGGR